MGVEILDRERDAAISALSDFPYFILNNINKDGTKNMRKYKDRLINIQRNYVVYKKGAGFTPEGANGDYVPSMLKFKSSRKLVNKIARFMFSQTPDIKVISQETDVEEALKQYQFLIDKVIEKNNISKILLQAAKDCFIGGSVACLVELSETNGIIVRFYDALHFYHEYETGTDILLRFVCYEELTQQETKAGKMFLVKDYVLSGDRVSVTNIIYDGMGKIVETLITAQIDMDEIPAVVITNGGLLDDKNGVSEIEETEDAESAYSKLSNIDIDSVRKGANPVYVLIDMNPETTKGLSIAPGSVWDIHSDQNQDNVCPNALVLSPSMTHSEPVKSTLQRIRQDMYESVDVPDISTEGLLSGITSFKALKALYYPLTVRCDEKMKTWIPALKKVFKIVIMFGLLEPELINGLYAIALKKDQVYDIMVEQNYALLEDENEEREIDIQEVQTKTMSVLSYLKKWRSDDLRTDQQRQDELTQIAIEANMFDSMSLNMGVQSELEKQATGEKVEEDVKEVETKQAAEGQSTKTIIAEES